MIRTVVFDMGNVLVRFSHERMCEQMGRLCDRTEREIRSLLIDSGMQWEFERGRLDEAGFHRRFEEAVGRRVPIDDLRHAASDIFEPNEEVGEIAARVKAAGHRLVLLSNTSIAHYEFIREQWRMLEPFDEFVLSYEVGAIKPEPKIFEAALGATGRRRI